MSSFSDGFGGNISFPHFKVCNIIDLVHYGHIWYIMGIAICEMSATIIVVYLLSWLVASCPTQLLHQLWQCSKLFMNPSQEVDSTDPKDTDITGLLNFIDHCTVPRSCVNNPDNLNQVYVNFIKLGSSKCKQS